jgi:hypothetical protein
MNLAISIIIAMILIPMISYLTSKLKSLPVQLVCSSISITVLALEIFSQLTLKSEIGEDAPFALVLGIIALLACSIISISGYMSHSSDKTLKSKKLKDIAYVYSLFAACCSLVFSYIFVSKANYIFSAGFGEIGALKELFNNLFGDKGGLRWIIYFVTFIFLASIGTRMITDRLLLPQKNNKSENNG